MSNNFLVSDSLKGSLTEDMLYDQACNSDADYYKVFELRICKDEIELDILFDNIDLREHVHLTQFKIDNTNYNLCKSLKFNLKRIYRSRDNLLMSTIVINSKDFWSSLL